MINPAPGNSKRRNSGPLRRCRHAPPDHQVGSIDDRLFDNMALKFDPHHIRVSGRIVPQRQGANVGIVARLFPARPVRRASLEPSSILAATVDAVQVGLSNRSGIQQNVRVVAIHPSR